MFKIRNKNNQKLDARRIGDRCSKFKTKILKPHIKFADCYNAVIFYFEHYFPRLVTTIQIHRSVT